VADVIRYERQGALLDIVLSDPEGGSFAANLAASALSARFGGET
jgi:hypothetical protein